VRVDLAVRVAVAVHVPHAGGVSREVELSRARPVLQAVIDARLGRAAVDARVDLRARVGARAGVEAADLLFSAALSDARVGPIAGLLAREGVREVRLGRG